jgi:hypothetical protein
MINWSGVSVAAYDCALHDVCAKQRTVDECTVYSMIEPHCGTASAGTNSVWAQIGEETSCCVECNCTMPGKRM